MPVTVTGKRRLDRFTVGNLAHDYTEANLPWAYTATSEWEDRRPFTVPVIDLSATGATFWDRLNNTVNSQSGRFLCRLPEGRFALSSFRLIGGSGDQSYSFGFWFPKLAGFIGAGPDKTFLEMAANSMTQAQLDRLAGMKQADFAPNQMGLCRVDASTTAPGFFGGLTFMADNQNPLTMVDSDFSGNVAQGQPAPHQGVTLYPSDQGAKFVLSHVRFQGAGKAWMSQPPFEMANVTSSRCNINWYNCEFDGRISEKYNAARPRKCGPWMGNDEYESRMLNCWLHHSNVSRYAANDEGQSATGRVYALTRCKIEQITNTQNDGNGGFTNATPLGWESTNAELILTDNIVSQDNSNTAGQIPQHFQVTSVGGFNPSGGRMRIYGGTFRQPLYPQLDGWVCIRATSSAWVTDGYATTIHVYPNSDGTGTRKQPWNYTGTWPPTAAQILAAGVTPETHYLVRN